MNTQDTLTSFIPSLGYKVEDFQHLIKVLSDKRIEKSQVGSHGGSEHIKDVFRFHDTVYFLQEVHWWDRNLGGIGMGWGLYALSDAEEKPRVMRSEVFRDQFDPKKDRPWLAMDRILGVSQDWRGIWYLELGSAKQQRYGVRPFRTPCGKTVGECSKKERVREVKYKYNFMFPPTMAWSRTSCECGVCYEDKGETIHRFPDPNGSWDTVEVSEYISIR